MSGLIAMQQFKLKAEFGDSKVPFGPHFDRTVGDIAECAMSTTKGFLPEISEFAKYRAVGIINTNHTHDFVFGRPHKTIITYS